MRGATSSASSRSSAALLHGMPAVRSVIEKKVDDFTSAVFIILIWARCSRISGLHSLQIAGDRDRPIAPVFLRM